MAEFQWAFFNKAVIAKGNATWAGSAQHEGSSSSSYENIKAEMLKLRRRKELNKAQDTGQTGTLKDRVSRCVFDTSSCRVLSFVPPVVLSFVPPVGER